MLCAPSVQYAVFWHLFCCLFFSLALFWAKSELWLRIDAYLARVAVIAASHPRVLNTPLSSPDRVVVQCRQLFEKESSTFTYILGDAESKEVNILLPYLIWLETHPVQNTPPHPAVRSQVQLSQKHSYPKCRPSQAARMHKETCSGAIAFVTVNGE